MLKRFILWDFPRASWQYDVMVGIILGFIFLTPRDWFRDQARIPNASSIAMLPSREREPGLFRGTGSSGGHPGEPARGKADRDAAKPYQQPAVCG